MRSQGTKRGGAKRESLGKCSRSSERGPSPRQAEAVGVSRSIAHLWGVPLALRLVRACTLADMSGVGGVSARWRACVDGTRPLFRAHDEGPFRQTMTNICLTRVTDPTPALSAPRWCSFRGGFNSLLPREGDRLSASTVEPFHHNRRLTDLYDPVVSVDHLPLLPQDHGVAVLQSRHRSARGTSH